MYHVFKLACSCDLCIVTKPGRLVEFTTQLVTPQIVATSNLLFPKCIAVKSRVWVQVPVVTPVFLSKTLDHDASSIIWDVKRRVV